MKQKFYVDWKIKLLFCCIFFVLIIIFIFKDSITVFNVILFFGAILSFRLSGSLYIEINDCGIGWGNFLAFKKKFYCFMEWDEVEDLKCWGTSRNMIVVSGNGKRIAVTGYTNVSKILKLVLENASPKEIDQEILYMVKK